MFCKHCGFELPENSKFCPKCGKVNDFSENESEAGYEELPEIEMFSESAIDNEAKNSLGGKILTQAIISLAFTSTFYLSPVGLIFAIIARTLVGRYTGLYGETSGRATVGKHLSLAGLILSIVLSALLLLLLVATVISAIGVAGMDIDVYDPYGF